VARMSAISDCQLVMPPTLRFPVDDGNVSVTGGVGHTVSITDQNPGMGIGRRIKERRIELGLSVKSVADAAGMAATTLYDLEREEQHSTTRLHALCRVLGLNPEWADSGRGSRLSGSPTSAVEVVEPDQKTTAGDDMAAIIAREVLEIALLISSVAEPFRSQLMDLARTLPKKKPAEGEDTGVYRVPDFGQKPPR
jgi:transcriptional regulator with XRE-family HTH domain